MKYIWNFCLFWWDFIVGDSIALAVGGAAALIVAGVLAHNGASTAAEFVLPGAVLATLAAALMRT